jgi:hypothetical protein
MISHMPHDEMHEMMLDRHADPNLVKNNLWVAYLEQKNKAEFYEHIWNEAEKERND